MRLFEMRGDDAAHVLVDLADPISRLVSNQEIGKALSKVERLCSTGMPGVMLCPLLVVAFKPLLQSNREDLFRVAAALLGKSYEEICAQPIHRTVRGVMDVWEHDLRDFFTSSADTEAAE